MKQLVSAICLCIGEEKVVELPGLYLHGIFRMYGVVVHEGRLEVDTIYGWQEVFPFRRIIDHIEVNGFRHSKVYRVAPMILEPQEILPLLLSYLQPKEFNHASLKTA